VETANSGGAETAAVPSGSTEASFIRAMQWLESIKRGSGENSLPSRHVACIEVSQGRVAAEAEPTVTSGRRAMGPQGQQDWRIA